MNIDRRRVARARRFDHCGDARPARAESSRGAWCLVGYITVLASIERVDRRRRIAGRARAIATDGDASSVGRRASDAPPRSVAARRFARSLDGSRPLVLSSPERFVQTGENLRSVPFPAVHRAQESSHAVVAPVFPFLEVSLFLENPSHASRFRRREPRARDELAGAEESAQSHGAADGGEDRVHLRARGRDVVSRRDRLGYGDAREGSRADDGRRATGDGALGATRPAFSEVVSRRVDAPPVVTNVGRTWCS